MIKKPTKRCYLILLIMVNKTYLIFGKNRSHSIMFKVLFTENNWIFTNDQNKTEDIDMIVYQLRPTDLR